MLKLVRCALVRVLGGAGRGRLGTGGDGLQQTVVRDLLAEHRAEVVEFVRRHGRQLEDTLHRESERVIAAVREAEMRDRRDIRAAGERAAVLASARFAQEAMPTVPMFQDPSETLMHALELARPEGLALEFGVYTGGTLTAIAQARAGKDVYGFDSFAGLPEDWRSRFPAGAFRVDAVPTVPGAELVVGLFADTLPRFLAEHPEPVSFLHVDADLYSSAKTVLDHVGPRLRPGTVILFDEYFNYAGWEENEHRAWQEFVTASGVGFRYAGYTQNDEQVIVQVTHTDSGTGAGPDPA